MKLGINVHLSNLEINDVLPLIIKKFNLLTNADVNESHINLNDNIIEYHKECSDFALPEKEEHSRK